MLFRSGAIGPILQNDPYCTERVADAVGAFEVAPEARLGACRDQLPDLTGGVGEWGIPEKPRASDTPKPALSPEQELAVKRQRARNAIPASAPHQPHR